ncbi:MAG: hypothetical protein FJZ87_01700 [Chloroflexi bacterium]|nr:hypothetical protein [Chloroflexota bacterium]
MDQTAVSRSGDKKPRTGCTLLALAGVGGLIVLVILAGAAYFFFARTAQPAASPASPPVISQPASETVAPMEGIPATTDTPQPTATVQIPPPQVESHEPGTGVQYPDLASLADGTGVVTILPNQPTLLNVRWCAKFESALSSSTSLMDLKYLVDGIEVPAGSFSIHRSQTMLVISGTKKEPAVCNNLSGLVRNWSEGEHTVSYELVATKAFNDGWKDHAAGAVIQQATYTVRVAPSAAAVEWGRCALFEGMDAEVVFLSWRPKEPLTFYLKMPGGVPGLEREVSGDTAPWEYSAKLGTWVTKENCIFQDYAGRLYCTVNVPSEAGNSVQPVKVNLNGCGWPVYYNPDVEIPLPGK